MPLDPLFFRHGPSRGAHYTCECNRDSSRSVVSSGALGVTNGSVFRRSSPIGATKGGLVDGALPPPFLGRTCARRSTETSSGGLSAASVGDAACCVVTTSTRQAMRSTGCQVGVPVARDRWGIVGISRNGHGARWYPWALCVVQAVVGSVALGCLVRGPSCSGGDGGSSSMP